MTDIIAPEPPPVDSPNDYGAQRPTGGGRAVARREESLPPMPLQLINAVISASDEAILGTIRFDGRGGPIIEHAQQALVFAKTMAADPTLPSHCHGNVGTCLSLVWKSRQWQIAPHDIAHKSYFVNGRIAFESQLIHAVVEKLAPIEGRLRYEILGEGDARRIKVIGKFKGEQEPHVYISEPLSTLRPGAGERGRKGSPLWDRKPEVQMWYDGSRDWGRMFCPDVILGAYTREEMETIAEEEARALPPARSAQSVIERLEKLPAAAAGFTADNKVAEVLSEVSQAAKHAAGETIEAQAEVITVKPAHEPVFIRESVTSAEPEKTPEVVTVTAAPVAPFPEAAQSESPATAATQADLLPKTEEPAFAPGGATTVDPRKEEGAQVATLTADPPREEPKPDRGAVYVAECLKLIEAENNATQLHSWWKGEAKNRKAAKLTANMSKELMSAYMKRGNKLEGHT